MKKVAIVQSNYIPWKGYFDMIAAVDEFILYDDMQYTRRDWRNRNLIKTPQGLQWLTIPVKVKGRYHQTIQDTEIDGRDWPMQHWKTLQQNYRRARYFNDVAAWLEPLYHMAAGFDRLSPWNRASLQTICRQLGISTPITCSSDYAVHVQDRTGRLAELCSQVGASHYISGPAARDYLDERMFAERNIRVSWFDYSGYPEYPQLWGSFEHGVSIVDLLFNCGPQAPACMKRLVS